jgi:hypothetical protein
MAAWIISALALLATFGRPLIGAGARALGTLARPGVAASAGIAGGAVGSQLLEGDIFPSFSFPGFGGGGGLARRRRRRNALSANDLGTALTIASAISKKAAENFILMRVRRS